MRNLATQEMSRSTAASTQQPEPTIDAGNPSDERQPTREQAIRERAYAIWEKRAVRTAETWTIGGALNRRSAQLAKLKRRPKVCGQARSCRLAPAGARTTGPEGKIPGGTFWLAFLFVTNPASVDMILENLVITKPGSSYICRLHSFVGSLTAGRQEEPR